ncbi:MAG: glycosyltransferase family 4 protein [Phycisphaerae bacterium]|nr:glycosyltransferase family 4 protein [Phycisphaerae bacterium]
MSGGAAHRARVAYLNVEYPSLSHTFIEREVRAVRSCGVEVETFSIRPANANGVLGSAHMEAARQTMPLTPSLGALLAAQPAAWAAAPVGAARGFLRAQRESLPGLDRRARAAGYAMQAVRLAREMRRRALRHVHVHMANNAASVAHLACVIDPRLSWSLSIHGSAEFFHVDSWQLALKAESARFVRCISDFCRAQVMTWTRPAVWDRQFVVRCGIDPDVYRPATRRSDQVFRILTVGRMQAIKGYTVLLDACRALGALGVEWSLDMVGDGPLRAELAGRIAAQGLGGRVTLRGAVGQDDIQSHFDRADVMVVSSFMEGVPVVLMEAMAKELPVVATAVGGIPELVDHGVSGLLVRTGAAAPLTEALHALARDPARRASMGRAGRARVLAEYNVESTGRGMAELFGRFVKDD